MTTEINDKLILENMDVVKWCIYKHIYVNESVQGLGYEDLYQIGCLALCESVQSYDGRVKFRTYAQVFVRNRLIDHCRKVKRTKNSSLDNTIDDERTTYADIIPASEDEMDVQIYAKDIMELLRHVKKKHTGITLKGIEAIELKVKGYSGVEIAALYNVKPNHLNAWISRARNKLRNDPEFKAAFPELCCHSNS